LKRIASLMQEQVRQNEVLGRYGGDEFIIFLPGTRINEAKQIAERIRMNIEARKIVTNDIEVKCTLSIGIAEWVAGFDNIDEIIRNADLALYTAKNNGRNRCELFLDK
jgi:diguanylate cyclase